MREVCNAQNMKKDISELCKDCPIKPKILAGIENQIIAKARERYNLMPETLGQYIEDECFKAMQSMDKLTNYELQGVAMIYSNSTEAYIWQKERIKALRSFQKETTKTTLKQVPQQLLPERLDTERARILFEKAIQKGLMEIDGSSYKWLRSKALLAYFTQIIYCKEANGKDNGAQYPETALEALFKESRLGKARSQIADNKGGGGGKPKNFQIIDDLVNN